MPSKKLGAYTLLEILVVMGVLLGITLLVLPVSIQELQANQSENTAHDLASALFRVQQNALSGKDNKTYGMAFFNNRYAVFVGSDFASAESVENFQFTKNLDLNNIALVGGGNQLIFTKNSLSPNTTGYVTITDGVTTYRVEINAEGLIRYYKVSN